ncbi:MAG TPA: EAL domain-containing protein [Noviherbaspirillum sp.]|uniref:EAL domain-containing protein n=1 Tax=Noviherbaspirillum sp. TaxID=1926288 RepID=UPI002B45EB3B|nr:EAL domain-containing protein [Noviherbaspirillum sp.]HJV87263.1 EAL domain-containing protein [Noviherbaspirillum sp.]
MFHLISHCLVERFTSRCRAAGVATMWVAVNVSVNQLLQKNFAEIVERALSDTGLPPHLLELEITESTLMEHAQDTLEALHRLRSLGVRLSIDNFGTGYSSLAYLKRFPVDIIKIDRSFVRDVPGDSDDASIVTSIIALAHSLRLEVVAEGVETEAQLALLRERSCDILQGVYLSKPVPAEQLARNFIENAQQRWEGRSKTLPGIWAAHVHCCCPLPSQRRAMGMFTSSSRQPMS